MKKRNEQKVVVPKVTDIDRSQYRQKFNFLFKTVQVI